MNLARSADSRRTQEHTYPGVNYALNPPASNWSGLRAASTGPNGGVRPRALRVRTAGGTHQLSDAQPSRRVQGPKHTLAKGKNIPQCQMRTTYGLSGGSRFLHVNPN